MNRDEFCTLHGSYYFVLENDFLETERYVGFDLGDNYLYDDHNVTDYGYSKTFSNEYVKQYQAICSEVDVILQSICKEFDKDGIKVNENANDKRDNIKKYSKIVLPCWPNIPKQKVKMKSYELLPFMNWKINPNFNSPDWWKPYNQVKHNRIHSYTEANLKNVANALAGLYVLECYFMKYIGDRDSTIDVLNDRSKLFLLVDFKTNHLSIGHDFSFQIERNED